MDSIMFGSVAVPVVGYCVISEGSVVEFSDKQDAQVFASHRALQVFPIVDIKEV